MTYIVDIKTRFISSDQRIYIVFPGEGYRFYNDMKAQSAVFLDIPGFLLPTIKDNNVVDDKDFVQRLTMSERIKRWHANGRDADEKPVRNLKDVENFKRTKKKLQFSGLIRNFYFGLRKGDIVIVPSRSYDDDVLFGEIIDDVASSYVQIDKYPKEQIPVRKVRWVKSVKRGKIPFALERSIPIPSPVHQIEQSLFKNIFDIMYQRYHFKDNFVCKYSVTSDEFSSLDDYFFQEIMLYVTALFAKNNDGGLSQINNEKIADLVRAMQRSESIPDLRISINSPGHIVSYAKTITPIIAAVLIALSSANVLADGVDLKNFPIQIVNSADNSQAAQECQADVQREVLDDLKAMGYENWQEICKSEKLIRDNTGLNSGVTVKKQVAKK